MKKEQPIFITGATGFLGKQFITDLLQDGYQVCLLARSQSRQAKEAKQYWGKSPYTSSIRWVEGDLNQPGLGISASDRQALKGKISTVYHLAALVKFDPELEKELYHTNLVGTRHAMDFSEQVGAHHFYYVSTAYTCGRAETAAEHLHPVDAAFTNFYEKSKCMAEHEVMARKPAFEHIGIFRPSIVVGHSETGIANTPLTLYGFMRGLELFKRRLQKAKQWGMDTLFLQGDPNGTQNLVPVDYVSRVMKAVLVSPIQSGIFHVVNPKPPNNGQIFTMIRDFLDVHSIILKDLQSFPHRGENPLQSMLHSFVEVYRSYLQRNISFDDHHTMNLLHSIGQAPLEMTEEMLSRIIHGYHHSAS
jgi:nucleoside-diphosphate-sugar epimerase